MSVAVLSSSGPPVWFVCIPALALYKESQRESWQWLDFVGLRKQGVNQFSLFKRVFSWKLIHY